MRVFLDSNILLSALLVRGTAPDQLYKYWRDGKFTLVVCEPQLAELNEVSRRPFFQKRVKRADIGRLVNDLRRLGVFVEGASDFRFSADPDDDLLLAAACAGGADYFVTGDKSHLLGLERCGSTRIVTARFLVGVLEG